jgi:hypothetical protein
MADTKDAPEAVATATATAPGGTGSRIDDAANAERRLARYAAMGIPLATVGGAVGMAVLMGLGPAILVLAAGVLLGTIALLWASLRTLSGDAPLPADLEAVAIRSRKVDNLGEQKRRVLRALKDLELEHSVGKIDEKDFASLGDRFRSDAKAIMREMDGQIDPFRDEAERLVKKHLDKRGLGDGAPAQPRKARVEADDADDADDRDGEDDAKPAVVPPPKASKPGKSKRSAKGAPETPSRVACPKCDVSNEPDAAFCKKCGASLTIEESHA